MTFAEIIRFHRERLGLNKKQLAEKVGVTQPYIVQIENDGKIPGDGVVLRLADSLSLDRRELLFAAYRARASEDTRHYFQSIFDDLEPAEEFNQPFIEARKDQFESPDFSLRHLGTAADHSFQVAILRAKAPEARFSSHAHRVAQVFVAVEGKFEIRVGDDDVIVEPGGQVSVDVPPGTKHRIRCLEVGRLLSVSLGQVVRTGGTTAHAAAEASEA
jgi:transcriptional regulator with XRE-family HTH domain